MENFEQKYDEYFKRIEKNEKQSFWKLMGIAISVLIIIIIFIYKSIDTVSEKNKEIGLQKKELIMKYETLSDFKNEVIKTYKKIDSLHIDNNTHDIIESSIATINELPNIAYERGSTVVRYYKRDNDDPEIIKIINDLGFYLNVKPVDFNKKKVNKINTIWYGDSVKVKELKQLTKYLIETTNEFKAIKKFKDHKDYRWKSKAIELGYSSKSEKNETLTKEYINNLLIE